MCIRDSCNIGLQCNLRFLNTTLLQGSVAMRVNDGRIFNDFLIANLLLNYDGKKFLNIGQDLAKLWQKIKWYLFSRTRGMKITPL